MPDLRRILLVDDDRALVTILVAALGDEGFDVHAAYTGLAGLRAFDEVKPDLVLLDVLMPELDGLEVCRRLRRTSHVPIILLTSRGEEVDRINGLDTGADDYVTKPFSTRELCARIRAIGRRVASNSPVSAEVVQSGALEIDSSRFRVAWRGVEVPVTRTEFDVLHALASRPGHVLSRERLLDLAKGGDVVVTDRTVDTYVKRLRHKLRDADPAFDGIETVIGVGYRWREPA